MHAAVGDRMVIAAARVHGPIRDGEITSTGPDGGPPYRIRWSDTGDETLFFPGPDAHVDHLTSPAEDEQADDEQADDQQAPPRPAHTKSWRIDVFLFEDEHATTAQAVLHGDAPTPVGGRGQARRHPGEPDVPEIGDEVAVSRALRRLSELLLQTASDDLTKVSGHPVTLPR